MEHIIYPIGRMATKEHFTDDELALNISEIESLPSRLNESLANIKPEHLTQSYREGGWNLKQIVHHLADSHMNAYIRFKLALTEGNPTIKPYDENLWAAHADANNNNILPSLAILGGMHIRWAEMLRATTFEQFDRTFFHPEKNRSVNLKEHTYMYAWHGSHHLGQMEYILRR